MCVKNDLSEMGFDDKCQLIIKLGKAAHGYGSPAIRLESYLKRLSDAFGLQGEFHSTPNEMIFAFRKSDEDWQRLHISSAAGGLDLTKLLKVDELVDDILAGSISKAAAESRLKELNKAADPYSNTLLAISYMLIGAGIAALFSGGWIDIIASSVLSLVVFIMVWQAGRKGAWVADWLPLSSAFVAGALAVGTKYFFPDLNYVLVTLSAIIVLVPGFSVSAGIAELVNNHMVSGMTNLVNGLVYLFKQFIGAWLGFKLVLALIAVPSGTSNPVDPLWLWVLVPAIFIGLVLVYQTAARYLPWALLSCTLGYAGIVIGGDLLGSNFGNLLGAVVVVVFANIWEWKSGRPGSILLLPAFTVLVSGSIGFRGLVASAQGQAEGTGEFMQMFLVAITLTAGLLIANTLVKPKKTL